MTYNALLIAKFFIKKAHDSEKKITNLKLQKLLYFAQGWYLANFNKELFGDKIEAWKYGPAVRLVYREFSKYGASTIDINITDEELHQIDNQTKKFLEEVWKVYGSYTASDLVLASHQEVPWIKTREEACETGEADREISINDIRESFQKKLDT